MSEKNNLFEYCLYVARVECRSNNSPYRKYLHGMWVFAPSWGMAFDLFEELLRELPNYGSVINWDVSAMDEYMDSYDGLLPEICLSDGEFSLPWCSPYSFENAAAYISRSINKGRKA